MHVYSPQGQPFALAHLSTSRCPPCAARLHVFAFQLQPLAGAHCSMAMCPPDTAACMHVSSSQSQPFALAHGSIARWRKFSFPQRRLSPNLGEPCQSYIQPATRPPPAVARVKRAVADTLRCVHSKTSLFTQAPRGTGSKTTAYWLLARQHTIFFIFFTIRIVFVWWLPIVSSKYR